MGLFSSKKKTYVSSSVYNMAGDVKDRPQFLKTLATGHVLGDNGRTFTQDSLDSYLGGPGITLRRFGRWARDSGYNANVGTVNSSVSVLANLNTNALAAELVNIFGKPIYLNEASIAATDYGMWAAQYVLANYPDRYLHEWTADYNEGSGEIILNMRGMSPVRFVPSGYVKYAQYLYVSLNQEREATSSSEMSAWAAGNGPSRVGYVQTTNSVVPTSVELMTTTTVVQVVDGEEPVYDVIENPTTQVVDLLSSVYTKHEVLPDAATDLVVGDVTKSIHIRERYEIIEKTTSDTLVEELETGNRTTTVTRVDQVIRKITEHQVGTVTVREKAWGNEQIFIYRRNTGRPALDALFAGAATAGTFFPTIPIRIENKFVSENDYAYLLPWVRKAVRRSTNNTFDKLVELVGDNKSINDIDFAYMVFGCSLNTPEMTAKRYIYEFFRNIGLADGGAAMNAFWAQYQAALASWDAWVKWYTSGRYTVPNMWGYSEPVPEPVRLPMPTLPAQSITVSSAQNYNINITFASVVETVHSGVYAAGVKVGDLRIIKGGSQTLEVYPEQLPDDYGNVTNPLMYNALARFARSLGTTIHEIVIDWQTGPQTFRRLTITNPVHTNNVYGGKSVVIDGWEALDDNEESGFIIPMQDETLRAMPIPVATQLCTASTYMVFNCYQVVKQKWYQTGLFQIIVIIIVIVVAVFTSGASAGASGGLLGTNAAVGTAIGFSGTAAIVAGAIANAVVGMIVAKIISKASIAIFGDKLGGIIGAIVSVVAISVGTQMAGGQSFTASFGNMMSAENLFKLTSSLADGVSQYVAASTADIQAQTADVLADYQQQAKALSEKYMAEFGQGGVLDGTTLTGVLAFKLEDPATFLSRTLMNGTDIADMSLSMLDNFSDLTLTLPLE